MFFLFFIMEGKYEKLRQFPHGRVLRAEDLRREDIEEDGFGFVGRYATPGAFYQALGYASRMLERAKGGMYEVLINVVREGENRVEIYVKRIE